MAQLCLFQSVFLTIIMISVSIISLTSLKIFKLVGGDGYTVAVINTSKVYS